jgi:hypothetical protein
MSSASAPVLDKCPEKRLAITATALVLCIAAGKFVAHFYAGRHFGYLVDGLYCRSVRTANEEIRCSRITRAMR